MRIFLFQSAIIGAIKDYIDEFLPALVTTPKSILYLDYEPAPNEVSSYANQNLSGAVAVYVRNTKFPFGSQNGNWQGDNIFEIDIYGFSLGGHKVVEGKNIVLRATESANLKCEAIASAVYYATTNKSTLNNSFGVVDGNGDKILIGEKVPLDMESFTQEDIENTQIAECMKKFKLRISIEEPTISEIPSVILAGFNSIIEAYNETDILKDGDTVVISEDETVESFNSIVTE
jgi:hypothetical protein